MKSGDGEVDVDLPDGHVAPEESSPQSPAVDEAVEASSDHRVDSVALVSPAVHLGFWATVMDPVDAPLADEASSGDVPMPDVIVLD
ncbi:Uu.00g147280.m01.CDS01 [Anthostomella pinea]|uniref:Uu.00g147280.m01.CDS01 n=1 Tax=Anthostomella pinea TaxID=933095 RepID=A0AAI8VSK3_9PEZI|nr:Uu.00g147280.m01.CDS01 [Anthostomella pinea]